MFYFFRFSHSTDAQGVLKRVVLSRDDTWVCSSLKELKTSNSGNSELLDTQRQHCSLESYH